MRLLDKYVGREVISHAFLGFVVFTFVFFVRPLVQLMELVVRHAMSFPSMLLLFLCALTPSLIFTIPIAVLVGVLIGLGRLSADSEIVALHACGIGLRRLLAPIGAVALGCTAATLALTFWLSPAAVRTLTRLSSQALASQAPFEVRSRVFNELPHSVLYVQDAGATGTHWRGVFLETSGGAEGATVTTAREATIVAGRERGEVELHMKDRTTHQYDPKHPDRYDLLNFAQSEIAVPTAKTSATPKSSSLSLAAKPVSALLGVQGPNRRDAQVELQNRMAFPAACLVFALLGIPIGVRPRRGGRAAGLIFTLVLVGGYYLLWVLGDHLAREGRVPPWAGIWMANIAAAIAGLIFLRRVESVRKPNRAIVWLDQLLGRMRRPRKGPEAGAAANTAGANVSALANGSAGVDGFVAANGLASGNGSAARAQPVAHLHRVTGAGSAVGFPLLVDFYLLAQFFYYFVVLLAGFVLIFDAFTLFDLLGDISKNGISAWTVVAYFLYLVPYMVYHLAPLAVLVATLITLAILAKNNEVIALKASGISLYRVVLPLLLAGCVLAGGLFALDNTYLPDANQRQEELRNEIKGKPARTYFQPTQQWILGKDTHSDKIYNYEVFDSSRKVFGGLNLFELDPATFQMRRRVFAARATWIPGENAWALEGGWERDFGPDGELTKYVPFKVYSLAEMNEPPSYFTREVLQSEQMSWQQLRAYIRSLRQAGFDFDTSRLSVELERKFAFPLLAAIIVLLAAPFALLAGTRGAIGGLALAVGIGIVYWATADLFGAMGAVGQLPPLLAGWAPDAIFGFLGVYFFLKMPT